MQDFLRHPLKVLLLTDRKRACYIAKISSMLTSRQQLLPLVASTGAQRNANNMAGNIDPIASIGLAN
jgi:hypothetical protein